MKISFALGQRKPLDNATAWGCLTTNLAIPGGGSLVAGRVSGYFQLVLAMIGVTLTTIFGVKFILWYVNNWAQLQQTQPDMAANFQELWSRLRPAVVGFAVFFAGLFWAVASSVGILLESKKARSASPPVHGQKPQ
jgi:hypothetical protein